MSSYIFQSLLPLWRRIGNIKGNDMLLSFHINFYSKIILVTCIMLVLIMHNWNPFESVSYWNLYLLTMYEKCLWANFYNQYLAPISFDRLFQQIVSLVQLFCHKNVEFWIVLALNLSTILRFFWWRQQLEVVRKVSLWIEIFISLKKNKWQFIEWINPNSSFWYLLHWDHS